MVFILPDDHLLLITCTLCLPHRRRHGARRDLLFLFRSKLLMKYKRMLSELKILLRCPVGYIQRLVQAGCHTRPHNAPDDQGGNLQLLHPDVSKWIGQWHNRLLFSTLLPRVANFNEMQYPCRWSFAVDSDGQWDEIKFEFSRHRGGPA